MMSSSVASANRLILTADEQNWLDSIELIHLCTDPDWLPYEGIDERGHYTGIMSDFHKLWSGMIGKPIQLIPTQSWQQSLQFMRQKKCDVLSSAQDLPSRRDYLDVTQPFIFYPFAVATQPEHPFILNLQSLLDKPFAMVKGYAGVEIIRQQYPTIRLNLVDSARKGLKQVETGQVHGFIDTVPTINYQSLKYGISNIKISGVLEQHYAMSVGVRHDLPALLSIYNKAINATLDAERQETLNNWLSLKIESEFDYSLLWKLLAVLAVVFGLFFYHYHTVKRHNRELLKVNKKLEKLSHSDPLTGLPNRYRLNEVFTSEIKRYQRYKHGFSVLIMDIDHFKRINDSHGHVVGDEVIKQLARLLLDNVRDNDLVARWGGEEFFIFCPETTLNGARSLAEHLREQIAQTEFGIDTQNVTASFGVTDYRDGDAMEVCIKRADQALYQAKHGGRNRTVVF